jgi:hypothetical protein
LYGGSPESFRRNDNVNVDIESELSPGPFSRSSQFAVFSNHGCNALFKLVKGHTDRSDVFLALEG